MGEVILYNESFLVKQIAAGDQQAFTKVYEAYHPLLFQYAVKLLKTKPAAEDVCNEIFLKLWQNRQQLAAVQSLKAYLFTAVRNRTINGLKAIARSQTALQEIQKSFNGKSIGAEEILLEREYVAFIKKEVAALSPRSKEVFTLCREGGWSYEQVSSELGISRNAVKSHMVSSMKKLRAFVEKDLGISFSHLLFFFLFL